jgi:hypothetical protein
VDAIAEMPNVEIDQKAEAYVAQSQVGQELRFVHRAQRFNGLYFHDQSLLDDEIDSQWRSEHYIPIFDRRLDLPPECQAA